MKRLFFILFFICMLLLSLAAQTDRTALSNNAVASLPNSRAEMVQIGSGSNSVQLLNSSDTETTLQFDVGEFKKIKVNIDSEDWYLILLSKEGKMLDAGYPELPVFNRSIIIGNTAKMNLEVYDIRYEDIKLAIAPSKGNLTRNIDPDTIPYTFGEVYTKDEFYPKQIATLSEPYILRDFRGTVIRTNPFAYNPVTKTLRIYTSYKVRVYQDGIDNVNVLTTTRDEISRSFVEIYAHQFINWENQRYTPVSDAFGSLLIIYYDSFETAISPLNQWKRQKGIFTYYVPFSTVGTTAAHLQTYIQNQYTTNGIDFVLLVGDHAQIPTLIVEDGGSDPSFALVAGGDSYPDIFVGRFSATTAADVTTQVNKTITYERDLGTTATWLNSATGISDEAGTIGDGGETDIQHMNNIRTNLLAYGYSTVDQIYEPTATIAQISTAINAGRGIVNYVGHGGIDYWVTTGFSNTNVNNLTNGIKTPVIMDVACVNGNFTGYTCFAEAWLRKSGGGAVAVYASSINQPWSPPMEAQDEFDILLRNANYNTAGGLYFNSSCSMIEDYGAGGITTFKTWNIFGDPSLMVRTKAPLAMPVTHTNYMNLNVSTAITVTTGVPYSRVCISIGTTMYSYGNANISGVYTVNMTSTSHRVYTVTVTHKDRVTYVGNLYAGHVWDGSSSTVWSTAANWNCNTVPNSTNDVLIPAGLTNYPSTSAVTAFCNNMTVENGANVTVSSYDLNVTTDAVFSGRLNMSGTTDLDVGDDIYWYSGSTANITNSNAEIYCGSDMTFFSGSNVQFATGYIEFDGTANSFLTNNSSATQFYNLRSDVTTEAFIFNSTSTYDFIINGTFFNYELRKAYCYYENNVIIRGNLMDYNTTASSGVMWYYGTVVMDGSTQTISLAGSSAYVNNLTISPSTSVALSTNLTVKNKLRIESGLLNAASYTITVGGDWENIIGPTAFTEGTSTVIFNSSGHQYCNYSETFNNLVINKLGGALRVNSASAIVTCASYDWTAGAIDVLAGTFTANDLVDNGIEGAWYCNTGGTINLYNPAPGDYIDLKGDLYIYGGNVNVYGGSTASYWPYTSDAIITMSGGGVLDFKNQGVFIATSYNLTDNISGGTIRVARGFTCDRTDFNPTGGKIEFVGGVDNNISMAAGSNFYDIHIHKTPARDVDNTIEYETDKFGHQTPLTRANTITATSNLDINGYFWIETGIFNSGSYQMNVASDWWNFMGAAGFVEGTGLVVFDGSANCGIYANEIFNNLELNKSGTAYLRVPSTYSATSTSYNWTSGKLYVTGGTFTALDMFDTLIYGTIELTSGSIHFHQGTDQYLDLMADITITGGELHLYGIYGDTYWPYMGNASLTMSNGLIDVHDTGILISNSYTFTTNITGGKIKTSRGLICYRTDFAPTGGIIELYSSVDAYVYTTSGSFYNLTISKAAREGANEAEAGPVLITDRDGNTREFTRSNTAILGSNITCTNSLNIETGAFNLGGYIANIANDLDVYGSIIMTNAADQLIVGDNITWRNGCSANITQGLIQGGGNWWVYGNTNVAIPTSVTTYLRPGQITDSIYNADDNFCFGNLVIDGPGTNAIISVYPTSDYPILITGNLSIGPNYELDVSGQNVNVNGNLDLDGKLDIHNTTVTLGGKPDFATTSTLIIDTGAFIFHDATVPRTTYLRGILNINSGTLNAANNSFTVLTGSVNTLTSGNIICDGINVTAAGTFQPAGGTVTITTNPATANYNLTVSNGNWLPNFVINTTTGVLLNDNLSVKGNITVTDGRLDLNARVLYCEGDINVYDILEVDAGATLSMQVHNKSLNIYSGGRLDALGNSTNTAFFTNPPGYSNYNIESGGTIAANYATFQWANTAGVNVKPGAIIDTNYPLSNCTFKWGVTGGTLLTLNNSQNLAINNAAFITSSFYEAANVRKTTNGGLVNFLNATGNYIGETYDDDVFDRVFWTTNASPATPDLQILKAVYSESNPNIGETVTCTVTYLNASTTATGICWLDLYWNPSVPPILNMLGNQRANLGSIPAGIPQQYVFNVSPDASWAGRWSSYLQIDANGIVAESNETNNVFGPLVISWSSVALPAIDDLTIILVPTTNHKRLNWTYPVTVSHFKIYRSVDPFFIPSPATFLANVTYPTMQYVDTTTAGKYFYIVTAEQVAAALQNDVLPSKKVNTQRRN